VTFPANPMADSGCRSGTDRFYEQLLRNQPDRLEALAARAPVFAAPPGGPARGARAADNRAARAHHPATQHGTTGCA
jgi:hypothetical protein